MTITRFTAALAAGSMLVFGTLGADAALAQNYNAADAVSLSRYGAMPCSQFTQLSRSAQDNIVRHMVNAAPTLSLSTPTGPNFDSQTGKLVPGSDGSSVSRTPLNAGQLIAACQAVSPRAALRSAFARFNSGATTLPPTGQ